MSEDLSLKVRNELYKRGLTHTQLARELGISRSYLSDLLRGKRDGERAQERIKQICEILGI